MIRGIAGILALAIVVGILSGLLVLRLREANQPTTAADSQPQGPPSSVEPSLDSLTGAPPSTSAPSGEIKTRRTRPSKPRLRHEDLPPQDLVFFDEDKVDKCWDLVHPHLVKLTVFDAEGDHQALGTIVDSRGWILTSYSAVKGASKIEVDSGYKTVDQSYKPAKLSDSVRGVIASDPQQDLAVLSVNRRFVVSFANITITENDFVVESEFVLQCAPPTPEKFYGCYESKVAISGKFDQLGKASQYEATKRKLTSPELPWIVCPDKQNSLPGSPLVRIDGTLEAIQVFSLDGNAHYAPVHRLKTLLSDAADEPQPMSVLQESSAAAGVEAEHPIREVSVQLNLLVDICDQFNWIATDKTKYMHLQEFSQQYATAIKYVQSHQVSDPELSSELQAQIEQIKTTISGKIQNADEASTKSMNELAASEFENPQPARIVPFFGLVTELEVSVRHDVLELTGTQPPINVALNPDQTREPVNREDACLAFVEIPAVVTVKPIIIQDQTVRATVVDLITRVDVSK